MSHAGSWLTWVNRVDHLPVKTLPTFANYGHLFNEFPICNVVELSKKWIGLSNQCSESIFKIRFLMSGLVFLFSNWNIFRGFLPCVRSVNIESWVSTMSTIIPLMHFFAGLAKASNNQLLWVYWRRSPHEKWSLKLFCSSYPHPFPSFRRNWIYSVCPLLLWYVLDL